MMEIILAVIGTITGIVGVVISLFSFNHNRIEAVNAFYSNDRDLRFIEARRIVHTLPEKYEPSDVQKQYGDQISVLVLSYEQAGILVKNASCHFGFFQKVDVVLRSFNFIKS